MLITRTGRQEYNTTHPYTGCAVSQTPSQFQAGHVHVQDSAWPGMAVSIGESTLPAGA